jgi:mRNA interferase RelE/StbE
LFTPDAGGEVKSLDGSVKSQLKKVLTKKIAVDPESYGTPLRAPLTGYWKHEFGSHRVIYRIYPDKRLVVVCAVGPRKAGDAADVYKQLVAVAKTGKLAEQVAAVLSLLAPRKK